MRIYAFTGWYPSLYKPYYDSHFADLIARGHDITILSIGSLGDGASRKAKEQGIVSRVRRFPASALRDVVRHIPRIGSTVARDPLWSLGAARVGLLAHAGSPKERVKRAARALSLPTTPPDLCIVHEDATLRFLPFLRELYPAAPLALYYYGGVPKEGGGVSRESFRETFRHPDIVLTCSRYSKREVVATGFPEERVEVLPLSFDLDDFPPPVDRAYRTGGVLRLLSVGRLSEGKGHPYALEALKELVDEEAIGPVHYTIVGTGATEPELADTVQRLGLSDHVTFAGSVDNRELVKLYSEVDALVLPSFSTPHWTETQGTVIQEAMLGEALVITTATGGVPDSIPSEMERFQVPERDSTALAEAIRELASLDTTEMARLGKANAEWVRQNFDVREFNRRLLSVVTEVARRQSASPISRRKISSSRSS